MDIPRNEMRAAMHIYSHPKQEDEVKYIHIRDFTPDGNVSGKGGTTIAYVECGNGVVHYALAKCAPEDNYNKKVGRAKAGGRLKSLNHSVIVDKIATTDDLVEYALRHRKEYE